MPIKFSSRAKRRAKSFLSMVLAVVMLMGLLPMMQMPASATSHIQLTPSSGAKQTLSGGPYIVMGSSSVTDVRYTITGTTTIIIPSGTTVTIDNRTAANGGSPFSVNAGAILNLIVNGNLYVYGQNAGNGANSVNGVVNGAGGIGGSPGISVPVNARVNITGAGTLYAFGGDAGDGGATTAGMQTNQYYTGGGGGAGAGIGGGGGAGGTGSSGYNDKANNTTNVYAPENAFAGNCGKAGAGAGTIYIGTQVSVYAYGGGGGSGGRDNNRDDGGGGGYPAAGIGGGGGGGGSGTDGYHGGGGFSAGSSDLDSGNGGVAGVNGLPPTVAQFAYGSSGYFAANTLEPQKVAGGTYGKIGGFTATGGQLSGNGGAGGAGGTVIIGDYNNAAGNVRAYNGSYMTTAESKTYISNDIMPYQTPIYAQLGFDLAKMRNANITSVTGRTAFAVNAELSGKNVGGISTTPYGIGIGSGAGSTEASNGTFTMTQDSGFVSGASQTLSNGQTFTLDGGVRLNGSYVVPKGVTATVNVTGNTILDNRNGGGSPFVVQAGGHLNLVLNANLSVYGQAADDGANIDYDVVNGPGGAGGYAGINVQSDGLLELDGPGTLYAYGGDAGNGGNSWYTVDLTKQSTGGGGGAGAGIGGNGGVGGNGHLSYQDVKGGDGTSAGSVVVKSASTKVFAYGGAGGSGGFGRYDDGGAGGYPGAGIGGGGAGGSGGCGGWNGAGGFSAGAADTRYVYTREDYGAGDFRKGIGINGMSPEIITWSWACGGYFNVNTQAAKEESGRGTYGAIGGVSATATSGSGGTSGAGGTVLYADRNNVTAMNGSYITTVVSGSAGNAWGTTQTPIYAQLGFNLNDMRTANITSVVGRTGSAVTAELSPKVSSEAIEKTGYGLGIGSGAGCYEKENGTAEQVILHDISTGNLTATGDNNYYVYGETTEHHITVAADFTGVLYLGDLKIDLHESETALNPIDVQSGANATIEAVSSAYLEGTAASGTAPGMAAIRVPDGATASISGPIEAHGGAASAGADAAAEMPGNGGAGAGAGIGGNGGAGGSGVARNDDGSIPAEANGGAGETAGNITIGTKVKAYGGAGANGGNGSEAYGGGGSGYPAAGVGGGGAGGGGGTRYGGDGYSGGGSAQAEGGINGANGGSAFGLLGGFGYEANEGTPYAGNGGMGGGVGTLSVEDTSDCYVRNGGGVAIHGQSKPQGFGTGAGGTESAGAGDLQIKGAPAAPATAIAELLADERSVTITFTPSKNTSTYTILGSYGLSKSYSDSILDEEAADDGQYQVTITDLLPNSDYTFKIYANNAFGSSPARTTNSVHTAGLPEEPTHVSAVAANASAVDVYWDHVEGADYYQVTLTPIGIAAEDGSGAIASTTVPEGVTAKTNGIQAMVLGSDQRVHQQITGLRYGIVYRVEVRSASGTTTNTLGGAAQNVQVVTPWVPKAPTVTVTEDNTESNDGLKVTFTLPENWEQLAHIGSYEITRTVKDPTGAAQEDLDKTWKFTSNRSSKEEIDSETFTAGDISMQKSEEDTYSFTDVTIAQGAEGHNGYTYTYTVTGVTAQTNLKEEGGKVTGTGAYTFAPRGPENLTVLPYDVNDQMRTTKQLTLTWSAPTDNGNGGAAVSYNVYRIVETDEGTKEVLLGNTKELRFTDDGAVSDGVTVENDGDGLASGEKYTYAVVAVNSADLEGMKSTVSGMTNAVATVPMKLEVTATGATSLRATWSAPENSLNTLTAYTIVWEANGAVVNSTMLRLKDDGILPDSADLTLEDGTYTYSIGGLERGVTYNVIVYAVSAAGDGEQNSYIRKTWTTPSEPYMLAVINKDTATGAVTVSWDVPEDDGYGRHGGEGIDYYAVNVYNVTSTGNKDPRPFASRTVYPSDKSPTSGKFEYRFTPAGAFIVEVQAHNELGNGVMATYTDAPMMVPGAPAKLTTSVKNDHDVSVAWDPAPLRGEGSAITKYEVLVYGVDENGKVNILPFGALQGQPTLNEKGQSVETYMTAGKDTFTITYGTNNTYVDLPATAEIQGLPSGRRYAVRVRAHCMFEDETTGIGAYAENNDVRTMDIPGIVSSMKAEASNKSGQIKVTWGLPEYTGETSITNYVVQVTGPDKFTGETKTWSQQIDASKAMEATFDGLIDGETYNVSVHANNKISTARGVDGKDYAGDDVNRTTTTVVPRRAADAPSGVRLILKNGGGTSGTLTWTDPSELGGSNKIGRYITIQNSEGEIVRELRKFDDHEELTGSDEEIGIVLTTSTSGEENVSVTVSAKITGLTLGTEYTVTGGVITAAGDGESFSDIKFTTWDYPQYPSEVKAVPTAHNGGVRVSWEYPVNDGDGGVLGTTKLSDPNSHTDATDFKVEYRENGTRDEMQTLLWSASGSVLDSGVYSLVVPNLADGTEYEFFVYSQNGVGWSETGHRVLVTPCSVPGPATIGEVKTGNGAAKITTITAPVDNGGAPVTAYQLYAVEAVYSELTGSWSVDPGKKYWTWCGTAEVPESGTPNLENVLVEGLNNDTDYMIAVAAVNEACSGNVNAEDPTMNFGALSNLQHVKVGRPEAPKNVRVDTGSNGAVIVTYDEAVSNGSDVTHYYIYTAPVRNDGTYDESKFEAYNKVEVGGKFEILDEPIKYTGTNNFFKGTVGQTVAVCVTAHNAVGESERSEVKTITVGTPTAPVIEKLTPSSDGVHVEWSIADESGFALTGFVVYIEEVGNPSNALRETINSANVHTKDIPYGTTRGFTLEYGHRYSVAVSAINLGGEGVKSAAKAFAYGLPAAPEIQSIASEKSGELTITFMPSADTGADGEKGELTSFSIYTNGTIPARKVISANSTAAKNPDGSYTVKIDGLANGSTYEIQVSASNGYGEGEWSKASIGVPVTVPGMPTHVTGRALDANAITVSWKEPAFTGGTKLTNYKVIVYEESETGEYVQLGEPIVSEGVQTSLDVHELQQNKSYQFSVIAVNSRGDSEPSARSEVVKTYQKPSAPILSGWETTRVGSSYTVTVTWEPPTDDGGKPIEGYFIYVNGRRQNAIPMDTLSWPITGYRMGQTIPVKITATNGVRIGTDYLESDPLAENILVGQLPAPEIKDIYSNVTSDGSGEITVDWNEVTDAETYVVIDLEYFYQNLKLIPEGATREEIDALLSKVTAIDLNRELQNTTMQMTRIGTPVNYDSESVPFTMGHLNEGETHYMAVVAYAVSRSYGMPTMIYPVTVGAPRAAELKSVLKGYESVTATWNTVAGGAEVSYYELLCDGAVQGQINAEAGKTTYTHTFPLTLGEADYRRAHTFAIRAVAEGDRKSLTSEGMTAAPWTNPSAPVIDASKTDIGTGRFTVYIDPVNGNGLNVTDYSIYLNNVKRTVGVTRTDTEDGRIALTVAGVADGVPNQVAVTAYSTDDAGNHYESEKSTAQEVTTGVPGAPSFTLRSRADGLLGNLICVEWEQPLLSTGSLTKYEITVTGPNAGGEERTWTVTVPDPAAVSKELSYQDLEGAIRQDLVTGKSYQVTIQAVSEIGPGQVSGVKEITLGAPDVPENVTATAQEGAVRVSWRAPEDNGNEITMYRLTVTDSSGSFTLEVDKNATYTLIENLTNGQEYSITVQANNRNGWSAPSNPVKVTPGTKSEAPASVTAEALSDTEVTVEWEAPASDGGLPIQYYVVTCGTQQQSVSKPDADGSFRHTFHNLSRDTEYTVAVYARNSIGSGESASATVRTHTTPAQIALASANPVGTQVEVMWQPVSNSGGSDISQYRVRIYELNGDYEHVGDAVMEAYVDVDDCAEGTRFITAYVTDEDKVLREAVSYEVTIAAKNETVADFGPESEPKMMRYSNSGNNTKAGVPTNVTATPGNASVTVTWKAPLYVGAGITNYRVYCEIPGDTPIFQDVGPDETSCTFTGLRIGTTYEFYVASVNEMGYNPSNPVEATPIEIKAPNPTQIVRYVSTVDGKNITLFWNPVSGTDVRYRVYCNGEILQENITTPYLGFDATPGVRYELQVQVYNSGGDSAKSATATALSSLNIDTTGDGTGNYNPDVDMNGEPDASVEVKAPSAPLNLTAKRNGTSTSEVTLSWQPPADTGGEPEKVTIQSYTLYIGGTGVERTIEIDCYNNIPDGLTQAEDGTWTYIYRDPDGQPILGIGFTTFQIAATNTSMMTGPKSNVAQIYVAGSDAPANLRAVPEEKKFGQYTLQWDAPTAGGTPAYYFLRRNGKDLNSQESDKITGTSHLIEVAPDVEYVYRVVAVYAAEDGTEREGGASNAVDVCAAVAEPTVPVIQSVTAKPVDTDAPEKDTTTVTVTWNASENVKYYLVSVNGEIAAGIDDPEATTEVLTDTTADVEANSGDSITVTAVNFEETGLGRSEKRTESAAVAYIAETVPGDDDPPKTEELEQVTGLSYVLAEDCESVTLTWNAVDGAETYNIYGRATGEGPAAVIPKWAEDLTFTEDADTGTVSTTLAVETGKNYVFLVAAAKTAESGLVEGERSVPIIVDTTKVEATPNAPSAFRAIYENGGLALSWNAPEGCTVTGYKVYVDIYNSDEAPLLVAETTGTTMSIDDWAAKLAELKAAHPEYNFGENRTAYAFQVSAINGSAEGPRSVADSIDTSDGGEIEIKAPGVPTGLHAVYWPRKNAGTDESGEVIWKEETIVLMWTAEDAAADESIYFELTIGDGEAVRIARNDPNLSYDGESGEFRYKIVCAENGISAGKVYSVALQCCKDITEPAEQTLYSGPQAESFSIAMGVNVNNNEGYTPETNLDSDGDGVEDSSSRITLTGTVTATGSSERIQPTFTLYNDTPEAGNEVDQQDYEVVVQSDGTFSITLNMPAAGGTYSLRVEKAGCTSYTLTDIVLTANDLESGVALGTLTLYAGDVTGDGRVDVEDYIVVMRNYGNTVNDGDVTGDGRVDVEDYIVVMRNYGVASKVTAWTHVSI